MSLSRLSSVGLALVLLAFTGSPAAAAHRAPHPHRGVGRQITLAPGWALGTLPWRKLLPVVPPPPRYRIAHAFCPGYSELAAACADTTNDIVYLGGDMIHDRFARNHELGHIFDAEVLTDADRVALLPLLNRHATIWACTVQPGQPGYGEDGCPLERFADAYAECRLRIDPRAISIVTSYGYAPTRSNLMRVCSIIASAGH